jgi:nicotinamide mononucleotide (NMN) deamidase PncC
LAAQAVASARRGTACSARTAAMLAAGFHVWSRNTDALCCSGSAALGASGARANRHAGCAWTAAAAREPRPAALRHADARQRGHARQVERQSGQQVPE